jgi:hypothetical protein
VGDRWAGRSKRVRCSPIGITTATGSSMVLAGLDRDDRGVDLPTGERRVMPAITAIGGQLRCSEEHLDERAGAVAVAEAARGLGPEPVMGRVNAPGARARASAVRPEQAPGLAGETSR